MQAFIVRISQLASIAPVPSTTSYYHNTMYSDYMVTSHSKIA